MPAKATPPLRPAPQPPASLSAPPQTQASGGTAQALGGGPSADTRAVPGHLCALPCLRATVPGSQWGGNSLFPFFLPLLIVAGSLLGGICDEKLGSSAVNMPFATSAEFNMSKSRANATLSPCRVLPGRDWKPGYSEGGNEPLEMTMTPACAPWAVRELFLPAVPEVVGLRGHRLHALLEANPDAGTHGPGGCPLPKSSARPLASTFL